MTLIYATTYGQTEAIFEMWTNGDKHAAVKFLVTCIFDNAPSTPHNTEQMAKETIERWIEDNFS